MPKVSKIRSPSTHPVTTRLQNDNRDKCYCSRCGRNYRQQKGYFPSSQSLLYRGSGGYLTFCNTCVDDLFKHYTDALGDERLAVYRMCLKLDIYWSSDLYSMLDKTTVTSSRIRSYISKTNLIKYAGKTFDDTLDEEYAENIAKRNIIDENDVIEDRIVSNLMDKGPTGSDNKSDLDDDIVIDPDVVEFWGHGFKNSYYLELDTRYKKWTRDLPKPIDNAEESIYKQICLLEVSIARDSAAHRPIDKNVNTLNTLLGSANLKPIQRKQDDASDSAFDTMPFGVGIRMYENRRPIPEADPELQDVDGIVRYISVWFLGHLCKMLGIKNSYCKLYEEELEKMRIDRPDLEEEDDETLFNDIFGDENSE